MTDIASFGPRNVCRLRCVLSPSAFVCWTCFESVRFAIGLGLGSRAGSSCSISSPYASDSSSDVSAPSSTGSLSVACVVLSVSGDRSSCCSSLSSSSATVFLFLLCTGFCTVGVAVVSFSLFLSFLRGLLRLALREGTGVAKVSLCVPSATGALVFGMVDCAGESSSMPPSSSS